MPTTHETSLDLSVIEALSQFAAPKKVDSVWIVRVSTHYLGGGRHFGQWEIADIGVILVVREKGLVRTRKVAVLQSKRLYPNEQNLEEDVPLDYVIGFGRLMEDDDNDLGALADRTFNFTSDSSYKALTVGSEQWQRIQQFEKSSRIPVHYLLYHPAFIPWQQVIPVEAEPDASPKELEVGSRVIRARDLHAAFKSSSKKRARNPTFSEVEALTSWTLEGFVADEFLGCREGYIASKPDDSGLTQVFSRRTGPIAAAISITIDRL